MLKNKILNLIESESSSLINENTEARLEQFLECLIEKNSFNTLEEVMLWFTDIKEKLPATVTEINLNDVNGGWDYNSETGNLEHITGGFFKVIGVKTETNIRESGKGWNQPMVDQGTESSVAGLIKKTFNGVAHYLVEAKFEPGNYDQVLFSPTLQVTYDNLNTLHSGKKPLFSEYFDENTSGAIKFEHWYPEDGGRFFKKRVKNMLVEITDNVEIPKSFIWLTMYQLKELLKKDNLVNPHLRSIISYL